MQAPAGLDGSSDKLCCIFSSLAGLGLLSSGVWVRCCGCSSFPSGEDPSSGGGIHACSWARCSSQPGLDLPVWGWQDLVLCQTVSHRVSVAAVRGPGSKMGMETALVFWTEPGGTRSLKEGGVWCSWLLHVGVLLWVVTKMRTHP